MTKTVIFFKLCYNIWTLAANGCPIYLYLMVCLPSRDLVAYRCVYIYLACAYTIG